MCRRDSQGLLRFHSSDEVLAVVQPHLVKWREFTTCCSVLRESSITMPLRSAVLPREPVRVHGSAMLQTSLATQVPTFATRDFVI